MNPGNLDKAVEIGNRIRHIDTDMSLLSKVANELTTPDQWRWMIINDNTMIHCYERDILALMDYRQKERENLMKELETL